jgi:creatinine amidohydrolase
MGDLTWPEAELLRDRGNVLGLIPLAAIEQHGHHLPLSTDVDIAELVASAVARELNESMIVAPVLPGGISRQHLDFPGTVSLSEEVVEGFLDAYLDAFERLGVVFAAIFSAHGGNFNFIADAVPRLAARHRELAVVGYGDWKRFAAVLEAAARRADLRSSVTDIHAGAVETSVVLAFLPERCRLEKLDYEGYVDDAPADDWVRRMQQQGVKAFDSSGVLGAPRLANERAGREIFSAWVSELVTWICEERKRLSLLSARP